MADEPVGAEGHVEVPVAVMSAPGLELKCEFEPPGGASGGLGRGAFVQEATGAGTSKGGQDDGWGAGPPVGWTLVLGPTEDDIAIANLLVGELGGLAE